MSSEEEEEEKEEVIKQKTKKITFLTSNRKYECPIRCIATNSEKILSLDWDKFRFLDSIQFMPSSLKDLGNNLTFD